MIIFDLHCSGEHTFEGWFGSREDFDRQMEDGNLSCPICGDGDIGMLPSGGHRRGKEETSTRSARPGPSPSGALRSFLEKNFENVGGRFAEEAVKMHFGEIDHRNIRGTMTAEEERDLKEEGVPYLKVPVPKYSS